MRRNGNKRPLGECFSENKDPPSKRTRITEEEENPLRRTRRRRRLRQSSQSQAQQSEVTRTVESQQRKRHNSPFVSETDENDITELSLRLKRTRLLQPLFFSISSFIEQTVDEFSVTVGEGQNGDATNTTSSFTFILPLPTPTNFAGGYEHCHGSNGHNAFANETQK